MRIGINWIFGNPVGPTAPSVVSPNTPNGRRYRQPRQRRRDAGRAVGGGFRACRRRFGPDHRPPIPMRPGAGGDRSQPEICAAAAHRHCQPGPSVHPADRQNCTKGFVSNISVAAGIIIGGVVATAMGLMSFEKVARPAGSTWCPFHFATPVFDPILILTMTLVMIVVMIESTGMFLALGEMTGKKVDQKMLDTPACAPMAWAHRSAASSTPSPHPFAERGQRRHWRTQPLVCVAGGSDSDRAGLLPKMAAFVESRDLRAGWCRPGHVRHGGGHGIRILSNVDYKNNRNNLFIVAISIGIGMIPPLIAPTSSNGCRMPHPLIERASRCRPSAPWP